MAIVRGYEAQIWAKITNREVFVDQGASESPMDDPAQVREAIRACRLAAGLQRAFYEAEELARTQLLKAGVQSREFLTWDAAAGLLEQCVEATAA